MREREIDRERKRSESGGLRVEWSELVVSGDQISDVEQEGEQDQFWVDRSWVVMI